MLHDFSARPAILNRRSLDDNREYLLEAGFPQAVISLLEGYAESIPLTPTGHLPLSISDIKIVKTAIGVLLNASLGYRASHISNHYGALLILSRACSIPAEILGGGNDYLEALDGCLPSGLMAPTIFAGR